MNGDNFNQDPLSYQFQNLQFNSNVNNDPVANQAMTQHPLLGNRIPLSRTTSMGIQRSSSPFANNSSTPTNDPLLNQSTTQHSQSALFNSWQQHDSVSSTPTTLHPTLSSQIPVVTNPNATSVFNQQHNPSTHSLLQMHQPNTPQINPLPPGTQIQSQWKYKDMQNNIQGPFDSQTMTTWYSSNYFQPDLSLCRLGTTYEPLGINDKFITLRELATLVQNVKDPFGGFDHMVTMFNNSNFNPSTNAMNNIVNSSNVLPRVSNFFPVANPEQEQTDDGTSLVDKINKAREGLTPEANINSGDFTQDEIFNLTFSDGSFYHEVNVPVPVNRKHVKKIEPDTIIDTNVDLGDYWEIKETPEYLAKKKQYEEAQAKKAQEEALLAEKKRKDEAALKAARAEAQKLQDEFKAKEEQRIAEEKRRQEKAEKAARLLLEEQEKADRDARKREEAKLQKKQKKLKEQQEKAAKKEKKKLNQKQKLEALRSSERQKIEAVRASERQKERDEKNDIRTELENAEPEVVTPTEPIIPTVPAPWANKTTNTTNIPKINLREQANLAQKKLDEKESRERQKAMMFSNQFLQEQQEEDNRRAMLTWASKPATKQAPVSIDIKSQLTKTTPKKQPAPQQQTKINEPLEDPSFIEEQKKIWEQVQRNNKGKTATASVSSTSNGGAWNTVSKKSNASAAKNSTLKPVGHSISVPSLKKPIVAATTNQYPGNASISARQEFLKWCKSQLRLNPGISMNSVLEVLLSLPSGPIANEIIADTIYSNSSVMDGRRFATEFTKRRTQCEKQVKDPLSWSEALALPAGNDDDWEFQVVSKKKGRKH